MCLIFFNINNHSTYKLIVAANRDEFYQRRTAAADYWTDYPLILGGRDLEANGTWLALTKTGKISLLTNYRDPKNINPKAPSRGHLVSDYLEREVDADVYMKEVEKKGKLYNGFNLIAGTVDDLWYYSNYDEGSSSLLPGLHGLSNHLLDTPWPKVVRGKQRLEPILKEPRITPEILFEFLYDDRRATNDQLPDTGVGLELESALSSMFIKTRGYGSRCSTVILVDKSDHVLFAERVYDLQTFSHDVRTYEFNIVK